MKYATNPILVLLLAIPLMTFQNPYDAMKMIEIKKGKRYRSSEKSLAIKSANMNVLINQIRTTTSGVKFLDPLIF